LVLGEKVEYFEGDGQLKKTVSFDDVLLVPQYSDIESRSQVSVESSLSDKISLKLPVISSPMDTVTEQQMATTMYKNGGLGVVHRYNTVQEQATIVYEAYSEGAMNIAVAVGMSGDYMERAIASVDAGANVICVDVAHGHHSVMEKCLKSLKDKFADDIHIMAGNVATLEAFECLSSWGADSIRVGIGGGSICSTRIVTGHGVPTLQSVLECARAQTDTKIIADGGLKTTGDIVKAFAAGADFVMLGSMLAGTSETPGSVFTSADGKKYKVYRGMASHAAQTNWRGKSSTPEGVSTTVPYRGQVDLILKDLLGGIRSGLSYSGCRSMTEFQSKAQFIQQSSAGQSESNTHILWRNK
jgi:IMP dehydrogenase